MLCFQAVQLLQPMLAHPRLQSAETLVCLTKFHCDSLCFHGPHVIARFERADDGNNYQNHCLRYSTKYSEAGGDEQPANCVHRHRCANRNNYNANTRPKPEGQNKDDVVNDKYKKYKRKINRRRSTRFERTLSQFIPVFEFANIIQDNKIPYVGADKVEDARLTTNPARKARKTGEALAIMISIHLISSDVCFITSR